MTDLERVERLEATTAKLQQDLQELHGILTECLRRVSTSRETESA